jgi:hypothetical protein
MAHAAPPGPPPMTTNVELSCKRQSRKSFSPPLGAAATPWGRGQKQRGHFSAGGAGAARKFRRAAFAEI